MCLVLAQTSSKRATHDARDGRTMRKRRSIVLPLFLTLLLSGLVIAGFWFGKIPNQLSPFPTSSMQKRDQWFIDPRLATLRSDPALCKRVLTGANIKATPIPKRPYQNGCGWNNAFRVSQAGGASIPIRYISCETAAGLNLWILDAVQPLAQKMFSQSISSVTNFGTYDCRNIIGNPMWRGVRSQHATANAIDISAFKLSDGTSISVLRHWNDKGPKGRFLRQIHRKSCRYFRVSLGPNFNPSHRDHFHFDRGPLWTCK